MTNIDEQIKALGYESVDTNLFIGYMIYENKSADQEVTIEWGDDIEDCLIFSESLSKNKDWFGDLYESPMGLNVQEAELFIAKIKEMRNES